MVALMMLSLYWDGENYSSSACDDVQSVFVGSGSSWICIHIPGDEAEVHQQQHGILMFLLNKLELGEAESC